MKILKTILILLTLAVLITGCGGEKAAPTDKPAPVDVSPTTPDVEPTADDSIAEVDALDSELESDELDSLESDLDELTW